MRVYIFTCFVICFYFSNKGFGQVDNDECITAFYIDDVDDYCSEPNQFTNEGSTASPEGNASCWPQNMISNDVWFAFVPRNLSASIVLTGQTITNEGTLDEPGIVVYSGSCNSLVEEACNSVLFDNNVIELALTDLTIGKLYFIRIDGRVNRIGSFRLCIDTYSPVRAPESDCDKAVVLCNKDEFYVEKIEGIGTQTNEVLNTCIREELASVWYKWTCKEAGSLTFVIQPNNKADDIDFALYELPDGLDRCDTKKLIRCMASGESIGDSAAVNSPCFGPTGLSLTDNDLEEQPGCSPGDNNFVKFINMEVGKSYAIVINNFLMSGSGFNINWGGTGTFLGPEADFQPVARDAFECDKTIAFYNNSTSTTDSIISWKWFFGEGATPLTAGSIDTLDVLYSSFGNKTAAISVETKRGCIVTKTVDLYVNPCCRDTTTLDVSATIKSILCPNDKNGLIEAQGISGSQGYTYSLDNIKYRQVNRFSGLSAGDYFVYVRDSKGCLDSIDVRIFAPEPVIPNAGAGFDVCLGDSTLLKGTLTNVERLKSINWIGSGFTDSNQSSMLEAEIKPRRGGQYILQVEDLNGCITSDTTQVTVTITRPLFAPNVFSPNKDGINDKFFVTAGKAAEIIEEFYIYDRWGNVLYKAENIPLGDADYGWDGLCQDTKVNPGVFVWFAKVKFLDDVVLPYSGDVTVVLYED